MTIDAVRAGARVAEIELDLTHRATGKTLGGFLHRGRQLGDIAAAWPPVAEPTAEPRPRVPGRR